MPNELPSNHEREVFSSEYALRGAESMRKLRMAVGRFTLALREMGSSPERVLIALKTVVNNRTNDLLSRASDVAAPTTRFQRRRLRPAAPTPTIR